MPRLWVLSVIRELRLCGRRCVCGARAKPGKARACKGVRRDEEIAAVAEPGAGSAWQSEVRQV
jgi:hypothetical protein